MKEAKTSSKKNTRSRAIYQDTLIREVRINYQPTSEPAFKVGSPEDVASFVRKVLCDNSREQVIALFLNGAHQVAGFSIVSIGTANATSAHPHEIFQRAIGAGAVSLIMAHNHPSENTEPSPEDRYFTRKLKEAGELLCIPLLDHVIVTNTAHYSFKEALML